VQGVNWELLVKSGGGVGKPPIREVESVGAIRGARQPEEGSEALAKEIAKAVCTAEAKDPA
jgi:hypothetical protein